MYEFENATYLSTAAAFCAVPGNEAPAYNDTGNRRSQTAEHPRLSVITFWERS